MLLKDKIYAAIIALLIAGFTWWTFHERSVQAEKDKAADQRVADAQLLNDQKVEDLVRLRLQQIQTTPPEQPLTPPSLVCHVSAPSGSGLPQAGGTSSSTDAKANVPAEASEGFNPSQAVLQDGRDADKQIEDLQAYIRALQESGVIKR